MTHENFADPLHRLENISKGTFFEMYAELRRLIHHEDHQGVPLRDLRILTDLMEARAAERLGIAATSLQGKLVDVANPERHFKTAQGPAE